MTVFGAVFGPFLELLFSTRFCPPRPTPLGTRPDPPGPAGEGQNLSIFTILVQIRFSYESGGEFKKMSLSFLFGGAQNRPKFDQKTKVCRAVFFISFYFFWHILALPKGSKSLKMPSRRLEIYIFVSVLSIEGRILYSKSWRTRIFQRKFYEIPKFYQKYWILSFKNAETHLFCDFGTQNSIFLIIFHALIELS